MIMRERERMVVVAVVVVLGWSSSSLDRSVGRLPSTYILLSLFIDYAAQFCSVSLFLCIVLYTFPRLVVSCERVCQCNTEKRVCVLGVTS